MSNNNYNQKTLCDRRRLGLAEFGDLQGRPVFYFHEFPGSRLEARLAYLFRIKNFTDSVDLDLISIVFLLDALGRIEIIRASNVNHHAQKLPVM
jgi:hypothetical protein